MPSPASAATPDRAIDDAIADALAHVEEHLAGAGQEAATLLAGARRAVDGGKRLRARLCLAATRACGGEANPEVAAALELFQAAALVHDDLMDAADTRRGEPSAHRWFERQGPAGPGTASPRLGDGGAILLGDLLLALSATTLTNAIDTLDLPRRRSITALFGAMSAEVAFGQYLDLSATLAPWGDPEALDRAWRVIESKTSRYSVELPLVIGARLAGADEETLAWLATLGHEVGVAYQLRDDLLGVVGEPEVTGKPSGDDIREGKRTVLLELAYQASGSADRARLEAWVGRPDITPDQVDAVRQVLAASGALDRVEEMIADHARSAEELLASPPALVGDVRELRSLVAAALDRAA